MNLPNFDDLCHFLLTVGQGSDDEKTVKKISGDSVGRDDVNGTADGAVAAVRREDDDGSDPRFKSSMQISETLKRNKLIIVWLLQLKLK